MIVYVVSHWTKPALGAIVKDIYFVLFWVLFSYEDNPDLHNEGVMVCFVFLEAWVFSWFSLIDQLAENRGNT